MKKVTKIQAQKAYSNGLTVWLNPCGLQPNFGPLFSQTVKISPDVSGPFIEAVAMFIANECNREAGIYPHFYISE